MPRTRTNVEIDDDVLAVVMRRYRLATKTEAVDLALRRLAGRPMTREEALGMRGAAALDTIPSDTVPADEVPADEVPADEVPADAAP